MNELLVGFLLGQNFECFVSKEIAKQNTKVMTDSLNIYKKGDNKKIRYICNGTLK